MPIYRLPSPNSCIVLRCGARILSQDGTIDSDALKDSHPEIEQYMEDMVRVRNAYRIDPAASAKPVKIAVPPIVPKAQAPDPLAAHTAGAEAVMGMFDNIRKP